MTDQEMPVVEPLFRANKRRKVYRRRDDGDTGSDAPTPHIHAAVDADEEAGVRQIQRRHVVRKHGIAFTSNTRPQADLQPQELEPNVDMAGMVVHPSREQNVLSTVSTERFVKPTGKAAVVDDKHMMAFVDTKMAEMRSASSKLNELTFEVVTTQSDDMSKTQDELYTEGIDAQPTKSDHTLSAAARSRTTKRQPTRPRRPPPKRDEGHTARDSLVDQIMAESSVPLYDLSAARARHLANDDGVDNDTAAMEAFKNEFLADSERHKKRKHAAPATGVKGAVPTSHGPKLGGSRAQRERMKAAEAAAAASGTTLKK